MAQVSKVQKSVVKEMESRDRLSELPDEVLIHILSFLPTLGAVRTMLIRRFGELWTLVTNLDFNLPESHYEDEKYRFHKFVRNVLLLHQAPIIHSFRLESHNYISGWTDENEVDEMHMWFKCAIRKQPKIVGIHIHESAEFPLPQCLFTSQSIVKLSLTGCEFNHQIRVHMGSLRSLRFECVRIVGDEILRDMVSGFPSLEKLEVYDSYIDDIALPFESIQELVFHEVYYEGFHSFNCPKVKVLDLMCFWGCLDISDLSSVYEASIKFVEGSNIYDVSTDQKMKLLKKLENAAILTFEGLPLKGVTIPQNRWKVLMLTKHCLCKPCIPWVSNLLGNSPYLEELTIDARHGYECTCPCVSTCPKISSPFVAHHLREVHINSENEHYHEFLLQLVEFFLKHATVLVELVISFTCGIRITSTKKRHLSRKISRFTKVSTNARVTFDEFL